MYAIAPVFLWQRPRPVPAYRHAVIRDYHQTLQLDWYGEHLSVSGFVSATVEKVKRLWLFYQGGRPVRLVLTIPLIMLLWTLRDRWSRFALLTCGVLLAGLLLETWVFPHYAAPIVGLVLALVLQGRRYLRLWRWRSKPVGLLVVWTLALIALLSFAVPFVQQMRTQPAGWAFNRARMLAQLKAEEGTHLVIVRYGPRHSPNYEWVYNAVDIDGAKVVWAREMDMIQNRKLIEYFKDRRIWLVAVAEDRAKPKLVPYPIDVHP
jgi:hypothetical protein